MRPLRDKIALDDLARELRAAVLASDHEKAERWTLEYAAALGRHWRSLSTRERAASSLPKQSLELLTWAREMTLMQHAIAAEHLSMVERAGRRLTARSLYLQSAALEARR
jgi:hypothetical protein